MTETPPSPPAPLKFAPGQVRVLTTMLQRSRYQFQRYGDLHMAKSPPQIEEAEVNYALVAEINFALLDYTKPPVEDVLASWSDETVRSPDNN